MTQAKKKILITGGSGLLGQYLNIFLSKEHEILSLYNSRPGNAADYNCVQADISDFAKLEKIILNYKPSAIIHTAAVSSPNTAALLPPKYVYDVNINATEIIAQSAGRINAELFYTSTDLVYSGKRGSMLSEDAALNPISLYAETKLMGEEKIKSSSCDYTILRISLLYGMGLNGTTSFFQQMYLNLKENQRVGLFHDQYRTPLSVIEAAKAIALLVKLPLTGKEIINFGGRERVSRVQLGEMLCEKAGFSKSLIDPISMSDIKDLPAVEDVSMNTDKLQLYGIKVKSIYESITDILNFQKENE